MYNINISPVLLWALVQTMVYGVKSKSKQMSYVS